MTQCAMRINYRIPKCDYVAVSVGPGSVQVEKSLETKDMVLAQKAVDRLVKNINKVLYVLPNMPHSAYGTSAISLCMVRKPPGGGKDNGLEYMHPRNPSDRPELDPRWGDSIVVFWPRTMSIYPICGPSRRSSTSLPTPINCTIGPKTSRKSCALTTTR